MTRTEENGMPNTAAYQPENADPASSFVPHEEAESIDFVALFLSLFDEKKFILATSLTVFFIATAIAFLLPNAYTSSVSFIPPSSGGSSSMAAAVAGQLSALGGSDLLGSVKSAGDLYAGILKSRSVASDLVKQFDLIHAYKLKKESEAERVLGGNTLISVDAKSTIVTVNVTDGNPVFAQQLANGYMDALRETDGRLALSQSSQRRVFFGEQLAKQKDELENAEVDLKKSEEQSGLIAPTGQTEVEIRTIAETQAQVAVREVQLAALRQSATDQNPEVIRLRSEIGDLEAQLGRLQRGSSNGSTAAIPTSKVPELQLEYVRKEREVKYHEALFDMLSRQYEAARLDEARDAPMLQMLDPASYPDTKSSPKRKLIGFGGMLGGFVFACLWVLSREPLRRARAAFAARRAARSPLPHQTVQKS